MKKVISKVIATPGYSTMISDGKRSIQVTQYEPVNLLDYFSKEDLKNCDSLKEALRQNWVEEYTGQDVPSRPESKIKIPEMKINKGSSSAKLEITKIKESGRKDNYDIKVSIPKEAQDRIEQAQFDHKKKKLEEKEDLLKLQKEELEVDHVIKTGKVDIPEIKTIRVDGVGVPINYKAPKRGKQAVAGKTVSVDLKNKKATKE